MSEYSFTGIRIVIKRGDITEVDADAIVVPANSMLVMGGGVAGAVKRKGGAQIEREAVSKGPVAVGEAVSTGGGALKAKYVIHAPTMERPAGETDLNKVYLATRAALKEAQRLKIRSVAFPGMGTGVGGLNPRDAARQMVSAILESAGGKPELVILVAFDRELEEAFRVAVEEAAKKA